MPLVVMAAAWGRTRVPPARVPLALAVAIVVQPALLDPAWVGNNQPRLAALALPALAVAMTTSLQAARLRVWETVLVSLAILAGSFHARYSDVGVPSGRAWLAIEVAAVIAVAAVFIRPVVVGKSRQVAAS